MVKLRSTKSLCPFCYRVVDSQITEEDSSIFLRKDCPVHGVSKLLLSRAPAHYKELESFYFSVMSQDRDIPETELYVTFKCNMKCPVCYLDAKENETNLAGPTCEEIEKYVKDSRQKFYILTGGEPTCREDLPYIVRLLKRYSKTVSINTNGIRLADMQYLKLLREAGLDRVNLQLDSFSPETERFLRGADYLKVKSKVVDNLRILDIPTGINCVIIKGVNEHSLREMVDFAAANNFIKAVNFLTIAFTGRARGLKAENYIMPDELVDLLAAQTGNRFSRRQVFLFQKLHLAIKSFFSQRFCFYSQSYVAVRTPGGCEPLGEFLNFNHVEKWLERYRRSFGKNKLLAFFYLSLGVSTLFLKARSAVIIKEFLLMGMSYFFKSGHYLKSSGFFYVNFTTGCDRYKKDYSISRNCHSEVTCFGNDGVVRHLGKATDFYLNREKSGVYNGG